MKNNIYLFFIIVLIFSCKKETNIKKIEKSFNLVIKDSLIIKEPNLYFQDYRNNKLLLSNFVSHSIGIYDIIDDSLYFFNKQGNLVDEYNYIYPGTLKFINDSLVGVGGIKGIKEYNFSGEFKNEIKVDNEDTFAPLNNFKIIDSVLISILSFQGNPSTKKFYSKDHNLLLKKNMVSDKQVEFAQYPNEYSDLYNKDYYYPYIYDFFTKIDTNPLKYSFVNSNDAIIYEYDMSSLEMTDHTKLDLENYNPLKLKFGKKAAGNEQIINLYSSGTIRGYSSFEERDIILYSEGLKKSDVTTFFKINNSQYDRPKESFWINIMDNKKKIVNDIKIPEEYGMFSTIISKNNLLFRKAVNKEDEINGITKFYYVELVDKK